MTKKASQTKSNSKSSTSTAATGKSSKKASKNEITPELEDVYKRKTHHEHILSLPDTYIGSTKSNDSAMYVLNADYDEEEDNTPQIIESMIRYVPGFFKIFDEIIVNARDHSVNDKTCKNIRVTLDRETGRIAVWNDGNGIPVAYHKEQKMYLPEMLFGHLLTSSNYDKSGKTVGGKNGYGSKLCLRKGTKVPTFTGEIKNVEDITEGEKLIGDDGTSRTVIGKREGNGQLFEITQQRCDPYVVNEDHILCLRMPDHKVIFWNGTNQSWSILWLDKNAKKISKKSIRVSPIVKKICSECGIELSSEMKRHYVRKHPGIEIPPCPRKPPTNVPPKTQEVEDGLRQMKEFADSLSDDNTLDISVRDYLKLDNTTRLRLVGYVGDSVQWEHTDVDLDPYVLGLWLGDGYHDGYRFAINAREDPEILEYLQRWGRANDAEFIRENDNEYSYRIRSASRRGVAPLKKQLSKYNLIKNKHIPKEYLMNSRDVRLKVLAGLIDSDGYVTREGTRIDITQGMNHEPLVKDIIFLAKSLGFMCCHRQVTTQWTHNGILKKGEGIKMNISGKGAVEIPTCVARKKCANPIKRDTTGTGTLMVKKIDTGDYVGLAIDGNQRFVLSDFTVTHNCNIYSKEFIVHTIGYNDLEKTKNSKKIEYRQVFRNNMYDIGFPVLNGQEVDVEKVKNQIEKNGDLSILKKHIPQATKTFTEFSYLPDYERFGMTGLTNDMYDLLFKRCYDVAACTISAGVKVFVNDEEIKCKDFSTYVRMYYAKKDDKGKTNPVKVIHEKVNSRWEIAAGFSNDVSQGDRAISFVNGISTFQGGFHVDHVVNNIVRKVIEYITSQKDYKDLKIQSAMVKQYLTFFVNAVVEDPAFNSQTKERLDSKIADWCSHSPKCKDIRCEFSDEFITKLCNTGLMKEVVAMSEFKESRELAKGEKGKVGRLTDIPKLIDAEAAGKRNSDKASLFITEGDSAKAFAVSGLSVIGSKFYGVFPIRGKLLNVRNATIKQLMKCQEFKNLKSILGLRQGKKYKSLSELRYGSLIILTDQDVDGSHIKGLVINMIEYFWPELLQMDGFIKAYNTYIVKAWKKTDKRKNNVKVFYTIPEFDAWKKTIDMTKWNSKYYKGLATSDEKEAKESFQDFEENLIKFTWENPEDVLEGGSTSVDQNELLKLKQKLEAQSEVKTEKISKPTEEAENADDNKDSEDCADDNDNDDNDDNTASDSSSKSESAGSAGSGESQISANAADSDNIDEDLDATDDTEFQYVKSKSHAAIVKAFDDSRANERKVWIKDFKTEDAIQYRRGMGEITFSSFIDKDLRLFSIDDVERSVPSMVDGLKPSQRMILYGCFKRGRNSGECKVAQLGAYVSEHADYHHGEESLQGAIIGMAQNFPGRGNNINLLQPIGNFGYRRMGGKEHGAARYIFTKLTPITNLIFRPEDDEILQYNSVDGQAVEPVNYEPILPMILINESSGIGTGFSYKGVPFNPKDVVMNLKKLIKGQEPVEMIPWFNGYKANDKTKVVGPNKYEFNGSYDITGKTVRITEIPIINGWIEPYEQSIIAKESISKDDGNKIIGITKEVLNNEIDMTLTFRANELQAMYKRNGIEKFLNMRKRMTYNNMHLFDASNSIKKYDDALEILRDFYAHRLDIYRVRKEFYLKKLENDLNMYKYKVMFIKEFLAGTIQIARVTSARVIEQLEEKKYPRLATDHRTPASGRSYRYLTDMSILSLTDDKIAELENKMKECKAEYDDYFSTPIEDIWLRELDEFSKAYTIYLKEWKEDNAYQNTADPNAKGKGKGGARAKPKGATSRAGPAKAGPTKASQNKSSLKVASAMDRSSIKLGKNVKTVKVAKA